jgi:prepilin-type N-terminal cleavage/methylation domain-containing protein
MKKGFTLIELLVVVVIVGILSVISIIAIKNYKGYAQAVATKDAIGQYIRYIKYFQTSHGGSKTCPTTGKSNGGYISHLLPVPKGQVFHMVYDYNGSIRDYETAGMSADMSAYDEFYEGLKGLPNIPEFKASIRSQYQGLGYPETLVVNSMAYSCLAPEELGELGGLKTYHLGASLWLQILDDGETTCQDVHPVARDFETYGLSSLYQTKLCFVLFEDEIFFD